MKAIWRVGPLMLVCLFLSVSLASAQTQGNPLVDTFNFQIGPDVRYLSYDEPDYDVSIDGPMYGISGEFTYHGIGNMQNYLMAGFEFEALAGGLDYDGQTQDGTPVKENTDDWLIESRGLVGYEYTFDEKIVTPFIGIGYRYWNNDIHGPGGYEREVQYAYLPIGLRTWASIAKNWTGGMSAEYDIFLGGEVKSHLSDVNPQYNDPEVNQDLGQGSGIRFSLHFTREFPTRGHSVTFEPYIRYWDIDKSDTATLTENGTPVGTVVEPGNESTSGGLRVSIAF